MRIGGVTYKKYVVVWTHGTIHMYRCIKGNGRDIRPEYVHGCREIRVARDACIVYLLRSNIARSNISVDILLEAKNNREVDKLVLK